MSPTLSAQFSTPARALIVSRLGQFRISWGTLTLTEIESLRNALRRDHIDDPLYILRFNAHPFLQGDARNYDGAGNCWALVEFWAYNKPHIEAWVRAVYIHIWGREPEELVFL